MNPFTFQVPSNILFEPGASGKLAGLVAEFGAPPRPAGHRHGHTVRSAAIAACRPRWRVGVAEAGLPRLAEDPMKQTRLPVNNLREVTYADAYAIYSEALDGKLRQAG